MTVLTPAVYKLSVKRDPIEILTTDTWPDNRAIVEGVEREIYASYKVDPSEPFALITMSDNGPPQTSPERVLIEVATISHAALNDALAGVIRTVFNETLTRRIFADRLQAFMEEGSYVQLLCHPDVRLNDGLSAIRHKGFDPPEREHSVVYACQKDAGVLVLADRGRRGAFIRPRKFCKVVVDSPIPTVWELLDQDPFGED
jgi:hypothetical protein